MTGNLKFKAVFLLIIITAGIFLPLGNVLAKTPEFRLDVDSLHMEVGVSANLTITLSNAQGAEVLDIKGLENFDVVSANTSTSTQIINGDTSYTQYHNYVIIPKSTGQFTLCGNVNLNGKTYQTNELQVNVSEAASTPAGETKEVFIKTLLSSEEIYFGQKAFLTYELYSRYNVEDYGFLDHANITGFITKDIPQDQLRAEYVYLDGNKYVKYEVRQTYLSPVKDGTMTIPAYNFQVNLSTGSFFSRSKPVYLQTEAKELKVKPLPPEHQPKNFSGIVGRLNIESAYSKQDVNYGESLTLHVTASGNCNLEGLNKIAKDGIPGFSVYETEKNIEESIENNQYQAKKEFEIILVPEKSGDLRIDPIHISYFDPETGNYEQAEIPGTTITVHGEAPTAQATTPSETATPKAVETIKIEQVSYQTASEGYLTLQLKKEHFFIAIVALIVLLLLAAAAFLLLSYRKKKDKTLLGLYRQIKESKDPNEIYNLFCHMVKYRFNLSLKASSREMVKAKLTDSEFVGPVFEIMDYMENGKKFADQKGLVLKEKVKDIYKRLNRR